MRSLLLFLLFIISCTINTYAQNGGDVSGTVTGTADKGADGAGATVFLLRAGDSVTQKIGITTKGGQFRFDQVANGKYLLAVTAVGYKRHYSPPFEITPQNGTVHLSAIALVPVIKSITGVTVTAKRPLIEQKTDRTVMNVEASVTNIGANALEVLEKAPGVTVDKEGNISLKGKDGVMVTIDGRPTQLSGTDLANLLRNMSSGQMDRVEIMTNPPARYDAAGNAGIINITTRKNKTAGYNGSATLAYTQGRYPKTAESFNFNYREGKVNMFTNLGHNYRKNFNMLTIQRSLRNSDTKDVENYFDQQAKMMNEGNSYNAKLGVDYYATGKTTVGVVFNGFSAPSSFGNRNTTNISTPTKELQSITRATVENTATWKNFSTNLNFRTLFDSAGTELSSEFDYITYRSANSQVMINSYFDARGGAGSKGDTLQGSLPQHFAIYSGRVDFVHPMKKDARFEAGIKSSTVRTDNNAAYDSIQYGTVVHDYGRSNHFLYEENINAAYVNVSTPLSKKISAQLGLRMENTNAKGNQLTTGERFDRHYSQLFPTAYFQYKRSEKNNFGFNYGRRIRRPNYESLNPFIKFLDRYTYTQGNPNLKPQFSHNIELNHTYKNFFTTTINYTATTDIIQGVIEQKGQEAYAKQANIASLHQYGIAFAANSFSLNGSQQFKLSERATAELSGFYRSAGIEGVIKMKRMGALSAGYSRQVIKNKGTIRLTVRDILNTQKGSAVSRYGNVDAAFQEVRDSRVANIGFTYRFNKGKMDGQRKKSGGSANDEKNRVGVE